MLYKNFSFLKHIFLTEIQDRVFRTNLSLKFTEAGFDENLGNDIEKNNDYFYHYICSENFDKIDNRLIIFLKTNFNK